MPVFFWVGVGVAAMLFAFLVGHYIGRIGEAIRQSGHDMELKELRAKLEEREP